MSFLSEIEVKVNVYLLEMTPVFEMTLEMTLDARSEPENPFTRF